MMTRIGKVAATDVGLSAILGRLFTKCCGVNILGWISGYLLLPSKK